jgi:RimJ/RimL family protein N-acetyltransferase
VKQHVTSLVVVNDADFEWMLADLPCPNLPLSLPPGGIDEPAILHLVRRVVRRLEAAHCAARWMVVAGGEVVGLCSYKSAPEDGIAEIGYGIASTRRAMGHATGAVAAMIRVAEADPLVHILTAETSPVNPASARVLEKNGFDHVGTRVDPEDGELLLWSRDVG